MRLQSPVFNDGEPLPSTYTCDGEGINPELNIFDVPAAAQSLALVVDDPDAPVGVFTHWLLWDIDPRATNIPPGFRVPHQIKEGKNDAGSNGFLGACPPLGHGTHHYRFTLYALDARLGLDASADKKEIEDAIRKHAIEEARTTAIYSR